MKYHKLTPEEIDEIAAEYAADMMARERAAEDRLADKIAERVSGRLSQHHPSEQSIPRSQWLKDCETLLMAAMYGTTPGGWSDPERIASFQRELADIEKRMRAARDQENKLSDQGLCP